MVTSGRFRNSGTNHREGVVIFTGGLTSLKRFKDDVKVAKGYDCGLQVKYNDIKVGDVLECFKR